MKSKAMCFGCRNDFYNRNREGGCWSFKTARIVTRVQVGIWEPPPYNSDRATKCLSCYSPDGYAMLESSDSRATDNAEEWRRRHA